VLGLGRLEGESQGPCLCLTLPQIHSSWS
jgi:hypothetical protein